MGFTYYGISNKKGSKRPTVDGFAKEHKGTYLLKVANHVVAVDGIYYDSGYKSLYGYYEKKVKEKNMKALNFDDLYNIPARMEDIPLYVKSEDTDGNIHIYAHDHTSLTNGCIKVNALSKPKPYKGKFGVGFTINLHNSRSTRYALKAYYVEVSHGTICVSNDNCTLCPLYTSDGAKEDCLY